MDVFKASGILCSIVFLWGCQTIRPIHTVESVDLKRFMGDWYVIASIPTFIETDAYNAVESYKLAEDGTIATTFRFNKGGFDGPEKTYKPRGFIQDRQSNAVWGMQFIWPFKAETGLSICPTITSEPSSAARSVITCGSWLGSRRSLRKIADGW